MTQPTTRIKWGTLAVYLAAFAFCAGVWYLTVRVACDMFFQLNQGGA